MSKTMEEMCNEDPEFKKIFENWLRLKNAYLHDDSLLEEWFDASVELMKALGGEK